MHIDMLYLVISAIWFVWNMNWQNLVYRYQFSCFYSKRKDFSASLNVPYRVGIVVVLKFIPIIIIIIIIICIKSLVSKQVQ